MSASVDTSSAFAPGAVSSGVRRTRPSNSSTFPERVAEAALYCAHRTIYMLLPSLLGISSGMGPD